MIHNRNSDMLYINYSLPEYFLLFCESRSAFVNQHANISSTNQLTMKVEISDANETSMAHKSIAETH